MTTTISSSRSPAMAASSHCELCSTDSTMESIEVDTLTVHTPDLDDVFFALTGHSTTEKETPS